MRFLTGLIGLFCAAAILSAHPMGNFSVNHYARVQVEPAGAHVLFVLDLAEIPTFELLQQWGLQATSPKNELQARATKQAREWIKQLTITSDGEVVVPKFQRADLAMADGAGGLPVMRISTHLEVPTQPGRLEYHDGTYPDRTAGWKEIVVTAAGGAGIQESSAGSEDKSHALTAYPQDPQIAPPQDLSATLTWVAEPVAKPVITTAAKPIVTEAPKAAASQPALSAVAPPPPTDAKTSPTVAEPNSMGAVKRNDFLSRALKGGQIGWGLGIACLAVAFWFGALHALEPGHGKTMVAAYLVGSRGTMKQAVFLGGMVTFTHTVSVFLLGLVTLFLSQYIMPDKLSQALGVISGLTIVWIGALLLYRRSRSLRKVVVSAHEHEHHHGHDHQHEHGHEHSHEPHHDHDHGHQHIHTHDSHDHADHHHHHGHDHGHTHALTHAHDGHTHSHVPEGEVTFKSLAALGASGGLVPCPSALVLLLSAISIGRTGFGLLLLVSFSLGLALVLMAMGILVLYAKNLFPERKAGSGAFLRLMPVISAAVILVIGLVLTGNSLGFLPVVRFLG